MVTTLTLTAGGEYVVQLATWGSGAAGLLQFAWVYVEGAVGTATLAVSDTDGQDHGPWPVPVPGVLGSVIRESTPPIMTEIRLLAGSSGFRGTLTIELLPR